MVPTIPVLPLCSGISLSSGTPGASNMLEVVVKSPTYTSSVQACAHAAFGACEVREHRGL